VQEAKRLLKGGLDHRLWRAGAWITGALEDEPTATPAEKEQGRARVRFRRKEGYAGIAERRTQSTRTGAVIAELLREGAGERGLLQLDLVKRRRVHRVVVQRHLRRRGRTTGALAHINGGQKSQRASASSSGRLLASPQPCPPLSTSPKLRSQRWKRRERGEGMQAKERKVARRKRGRQTAILPITTAQGGWGGGIKQASTIRAAPSGVTVD
jgi:hypothetical protein